MRRAPLPILVASLLLASRAPLGAGRLPDSDGHAESGLSLRLRLLLLGEDRAPQWPPAPSLPTPAHDAGPAEELRRRLTELSERLKRHEPQLSIDLTFHLLRQLLEISRANSQQEQAEKNRVLFEYLGK